MFEQVRVRATLCQHVFVVRCALVALEFAHPVYERHLRETGLSLTWPRERFPPGAPEWVFYLILQRQWLGTSGTRYRRFE